MRRTSNQQGASALEFGLVAPVILVVIFGIIQYGYLYWSLQTAKATAREAVRQLIVGTDWACTRQEALDKVRGPAVGSSPPTVTASYRALDGVAPVPAPGLDGGLVTVEVTLQTLDMKIPFLPMPRDALVSQSASGRVQNSPPVPLACS